MSNFVTSTLITGTYLTPSFSYSLSPPLPRSSQIDSACLGGGTFQVYSEENEDDDDVDDEDEGKKCFKIPLSSYVIVKSL